MENTHICKNVIGYTNGVFDLFHLGHVNLLKNAKAMCDYLIVGVITDEEVLATKHIKPVITTAARIKIVEACKYVDTVVPVGKDNKLLEWGKYNFQRLFVGDDHFMEDVWGEWEKALRPKGVEFFYFPYTSTTSTTEIVQKIQEQGRLKV